VESGPHLRHGSLSPTKSMTQAASWPAQPFLHSSHQSVVGHVGACPSPSKLPLPMGDLDHDLICGFLGPPDSASQMASRSIQLFLHSLWQTVPILYTGDPFPPKLQLPMGWSGPPSNTWFLGTSQVLNPNGISNSSPVFALLTAEHPYTLEWPALHPQNCPFTWGYWPQSNTWFLGSTRVLNPNGLSIGSAVFVGFTTVTSRQTDRPSYSLVIIGCIYVCSAVMQRKKLVASASSEADLGMFSMFGRTGAPTRGPANFCNIATCRK